MVVDGAVRSNIVASQHVHIAYGGVVPELASRLHERHIITTVTQALTEANLTLSELTGIAATYGPGLVGALVVGLNFAKGLASGLDLPFVGIDHMEGHLWANFLDRTPDNGSYPYLCLLASGGHTQLWQVNGVSSYELLGRSLDDAAGEAFDKGARLLGLDYPGGPALQAAAQGGNPAAAKFPRPMLGSPGCDFSFSGLKTALYYYLKRMGRPRGRQQLADLAASYQEAMVDSIMDRFETASRTTGLRRMCVAGGVSANLRLRERLDAWSVAENLAVSYPPLAYCTDNAAMIAMAGYMHLNAGESSPLDLEVAPSLSLVPHA